MPTERVTRRPHVWYSLRYITGGDGVRGRGAGMSRYRITHRAAACGPAHGRRPARPRIAAVYGGGGPLGIAYGLGVVDALLAAGVPLRTAPSLGTSAGSWVASCLATGATFEQL